MNTPAATLSRDENAGALKDLDCTAALEEFARRGFAKTSIVSLAETMGIARQTLYNRFGSKEAVLHWAITTLTDRLRRNALKELAADGNASDVLANVFTAWLGPAVALLNEGPYSEEILGLGRRIKAQANMDPLLHMRDELRRYLLAAQVRTSRSHADDLTVLLIYAAKGLMMRCATEAEFKRNIRKLLRGAGI